MIDRTSHQPEDWDLEADVVVVGTGGAGLTGAIVAASKGATVLALEKTSTVGGTTAISGGGVWIPLNHHMASVGVDDSREEALEYLRTLADDPGEDELITAFVDNGAAMIRYLEDQAGVTLRPWPPIGGTIDYRPEVPGAKHGGRPLDPGKVALADLGDWAKRLRTGWTSAWKMDKLEYFKQRLHTQPRKAGADTRYTFDRVFADVGSVEFNDAPTFEYVGAGAALAAQLLRGSLAQGVTIQTGTEVRELIVTDGRVRGVRALQEGREIYVLARRGVLLATGGFAHSEELKRAFLNRPLEYSCEIRTNVGDGHRMGMAVGAQVCRIGDAWWGPMVPLGADARGDLDCMMIREGRCLPHTLMVNQRGRRFVNESKNYYDVVEAFGSKQDMANLPAWMIFDDQAYSGYSLFPGAPPPHVPDQPSWLVRADSLRELADKLGIDPDEFEHTVDKFNAFARTGVDTDFRRGESKWDREWGDPNNHPNPALGEVNRAPFYAVEMRPGALATKGGLRINARAEVISAADPCQPIPGLYAAGNVSAGAVAFAYPGPGATIGIGMTFGFIAAMQMADAASASESEVEASAGVSRGTSS